MRTRAEARSRGYAASTGVWVLLLLFGLAGCNSIPAYQQVVASKQPMTFDDTGACLERVSVTAQVESGMAGGQSNSGGGCTACK